MTGPTCHFRVVAIKNRVKPYLIQPVVVKCAKMFLKGEANDNKEDRERAGG